VAGDPTELVRRWLERLVTRREVDLHELVKAGDPLMNDLLAVYTPRDFSIAPLPGSAVRVSEFGLELHLTAQLVPPRGEAHSDVVGVIERHFDTGAGWARHEKFELPPEWVGQGRGRLVTRESALLYEQLGIQEVTLTAVDYGRYVWAMCGFDFRVDEEREGILAAIEEFAEYLGLPLSDLESCEHAWDIGSIEGEPLTMRQIAEGTGEPVEESRDRADSLDEKMLPGKALLLFSDYEGYEAILRLGSGDPAGRDQLLYYTDL
jgi:hypothetical protein